MTLNVAFQMDPLENINIEEDTTFRIAEEALIRGYNLFYYSPQNLTFRENRVKALGHDLIVRRIAGDHFSLGRERILDIGAEIDVVWLRQDPPFNMSYITNTHLLDLVKDQTLVVNKPFWVRNYPEKLLVLNFPDIIPKTMITCSLEMVRDFLKENGDIILKPLYGNGGTGIFKLERGDPNLTTLVEFFNEMFPEPFIVQKFIPEVVSGDKRIILVDGSPIGAINRVPQKGEIRSNMHVGGRAEKSDLSKRDIEICKVLGSLMKEKGQLLVGIDVIGGFLTEINLTSPTGIQELERFNNMNIAKLIWDKVERKLEIL